MLCPKSASWFKSNFLSMPTFMVAVETTHCVFLHMNGSKYKKFRIQWLTADFTCSNHLTDPHLFNEQVFQIQHLDKFLVDLFSLNAEIWFWINLTCRISNFGTWKSLFLLLFSFYTYSYHGLTPPGLAIHPHSLCSHFRVSPVNTRELYETMYK